MDVMTVNGTARSLPPPWRDETLLAFLRFGLGLAGVRFGCGVGVCGACTVLIDSRAQRACTLPAQAALGRHIVTVEGFASAGGAPAAVLRAWDDLAVPQCGYCQPGQMAQAAAALAQRPRPTDAAIEASMAGVLCRCGTAARIRRALNRATDLIGGQG